MNTQRPNHNRPAWRRVQGLQAYLFWLISILVALVTSPAVAVVSSSSASININQFLGADRFYDAGYTGTRTIQANIEAGHIWNGHSTLGHVTTQVTGTGALGTDDSHATRVGFAMAGRSPTGEYPDNPNHWGIAHGAETWSGAIATSFGDGVNFSTSNGATASTYRRILQTGVSGQTADVFNSSWGFVNPTGTQTRTRGIDGLINNTGVVGVFSAGNDGPEANTVGGVGAGYNSITVGALRPDSGSNPYSQIPNFSSRGPNDFAMATSPTGFTTIPGVRAAVDIAAPGQALTLATLNSQSNPNGFAANQAGTSFAAPLVAGGASLIVDAGKDLYAGNSRAIDGRVVKAVLLNSADKISGWNNGQVDVGGVIQTTQSLDWASGAGRMNLDRAFDQYIDVAAGGMAGTTDAPGLDPGDVAPVGWDFGWVDANSTSAYFIDQPLVAGSTFLSTLTWFADRNPGNVNNFNGTSEQHLANLDLSIFRFDDLENRNIIGTVAESISLYNVVEHLSFTTPETGYYGIEVTYTGAHWNFTGETGEHFGLAWSSTPLIVPSGERLWSNPAGGNFGMHDNWDPAATPGGDDVAVFNLLGVYTVTFANNFTNSRLIVGNDHVSFALAGFTYELTSTEESEHSITIGTSEGEVGHLVVTGGTLKGATTLLAAAPGSSGHLAVGAGATWTNSAAVYVGYAGTGSLSIEHGAQVSNTFAEIGFQASAHGEVLVTDGSTWINSSGILVGAFGSGKLTIESQSWVSSDGGEIGAAVDAMGEVLVSDAVWENIGALSIGYEGVGALIIEQVGTVSNTFGEIGGWDSGAGTVTVRHGSTWTNGIDLVVGGKGSGTLAIESGSTVSSEGSWIAADIGSTGAVTVSGDDSLWFNDGMLFIGGSVSQAGGDGALSIDAGGTVIVTETLKTWETGSVHLNDGTLQAAALDLSEGTFEMTGGRLVTSEVMGNLTIEAGTFAFGQSPTLATVTGDYFQQPDGTLELKIGGLDAGIDFDVLSIDGDAILAGIIDVQFLDDYLPAGGEVFEVLTASSILDNGLILGGPAADLFDLVVGDFSILLQVVESVVIPGDFNGDTFVDALDLAIWEESFAVDTGGDANDDGFTDGFDFLIWQRHLSANEPPPADVLAVPEPGAFALSLLAGTLCCIRSRRNVSFRRSLWRLRNLA